MVPHVFPSSVVTHDYQYNHMKKTTRARMIVPIAALMAVMGVDVYAADAAEAERTSLVDRIIAQFNLNKDEVQKVVEQERAQRQQENRDRVTASLTDAVTQGKITEEQKNMILAKHEDMQKTRTETRTAGDRTANRAARAQERQELEQWAKDNNIDAQYMMMGNGMGRGGDGAGKGGMQRGGGLCQQ